ncbi:MAG: biliverdin-producing heme oxygenase [Nocardioides sp.]
MDETARQAWGNGVENGLAAHGRDGSEGAHAASGDAPLSSALREGSRAAHEHAESSGFVTELMAGRTSPEQYAAYLRRLRVVYAALEAAVADQRHHRALAPLHDPALARLDALDADLARWPDGAQPSASPAAAAYRHRLEAVCQHPHLLAAHHYTRYLGDLSGGRMLAQALRRAHPDREDGLAFYDFPGIAKPVTYKRGYRERLDALEVTPTERDEMVEEVRCAFGLNRDLLDEVDRLQPAGR